MKRKKPERLLALPKLEKKKMKLMVEQKEPKKASKRKKKKDAVCKSATDLFGWCFHERETGIFNCDDSFFCRNKTSLKGKQTSGCFDQGQCCCNQDDMCNYGHIAANKETKEEGVQSCDHHNEIASEKIITYKPCYDPYCFSFIFKGLRGGRNGIILGCQSRTHYMHEKSKENWKKYKNDTKFKDYDVVMNYPYCSEILGGEVEKNGTTRACIDIHYKRDGSDFLGKYCCCKGADNCNAKITWADKAKTMEKKEKDDDSAASFISSHIAFILFPIFFCPLLFSF